MAIRERPLDTALIEFAVQANISISTPPGGFGHVRSHALLGTMTIEEGLARLLADTGYSYQRVDAATYRIVPLIHAQAAARPADGGEIVVTARRRPEALDRLPASATLIDNDRLSQLGLTESEDVARVAAGLSFTNLGPGRDKIILRGLSDGAFSGRTESTVGVYLDETRITYGAPNPDLRLVDIRSVDILRGPQGAYYGGGSIGGIFHIVSNPPDFEKFGGALTAGAELTHDGDAGGEGALILNAPLVLDRLAVRMVAYRDTAPGWLDNPLLGFTDTNRTYRQGGRFSVAAHARGAWTVTGRLMYQGINSADSQYTYRSAGEIERASRVLEPHDNDFSLADLLISGPTRIGEFSATTSVVRHGFDNRYDATGAFAQYGVAPSSVAAFDEHTSVRLITQEARLTGIASPFPWSLGAIVSLVDSRGDNRLTYDLDRSVAQTGYLARRVDRLRDMALFGDIVWNPLNDVSVSFGARVFHSGLSTHAQANGISAGLADDFAGRRGESGVAPELQISYSPGVNALYYALASAGYRAGGFNAGASAAFASDPTSEPLRRFSADRLWNLEAGTKHAVMDERLHIRASVFWQVWENVQTDQLIAAGLPFTGNAGDASNRGAEVEAVLNVSPATTLAAHFTYADPEIVNADARFPASSDAALPGTPHLLAGASFLSHRDLGWLGVLKVAADTTYVGRSHITFSNANGQQAGDYFDSNLRLALERGRMEIVVYVDNIEDRQAATFSFGNPFKFGSADLETPLRPRTWGIEVTRAF